MDLDQTALLQIRPKLRDRLYAEIGHECPVAVGLVLIAAIATWNVIPLPVGIAWIIGATALYLIRAAIGRSYRRANIGNDQTEQWFKLFIATALACGAAWGAFGVGVGLTDDVLRFGIVVFCAGCIALATVYFYGGSVLATTGFALLALLPPALSTIANRSLTTWVISSMLILLCLLIVGGALLARRLFLEIFALRVETEQLADHLTQRRTQIEKLNVALKTHIDKREHVELNLRRTAADLGLAQGKAKALSDTLERVSPFCPVTGLLNRRTFLEELDRDWRRCQRDRKHITVLVAAIDHFTEYQDTYGGRAADTVLKRIAATVKSFGKRAGDVAARYGNEQFVLLLSGTDQAHGEQIAEAIRARIEGQRIAHAGAPQRDCLTLHVGVVTMVPTRTLASTELLKRLDSSIYEARFQGGNRVIAFKPLDKIKINRWIRKDDGPLSEQTLVQKLLLWGFDTKKSVLQSGTTIPDTVYEKEIVFAVLAGRMQFTIEGSQIQIGPGDCVFIPGGTTCYAEVTGDESVINFIASRTD